MKIWKKTSVVNISREVLHNRFVLYFIFFISILSLFYSVFINDLLSVGVFLVTSLLTSFFSKNMIVILVVAMVVSNVVRLTYKTHDGFPIQNNSVEDDVEEGFKVKGKGKSILKGIKKVGTAAAGLAGGVAGAVLGGGEEGGGGCCSDVRKMVLDIEKLKEKVTELNQEAEQKNTMTDFDLW